MPTMTVSAEPTFDSYYRNLRQVFLYVTDECNLRCTQCYYKPWLKTADAEMDSDVLLALIAKFRQLGAIKLSLLGGEATLYGRHSTNRPLPSIIAAAREMGYEYIRVVSNGLFDKDLLANPEFRQLDEITFSVDGDRAEIHNSLRGPNTYDRTMRRVLHAISLKYNVHITTCVHRGNIGRTDDGQLLLDRAIQWAASLGASLINFHPLFKMDIPRDSWTGATDIDPHEWMEVYGHIRRSITSGSYAIPVRLPRRFVSAATFDQDPSYYSFCPVKLAERIEVHPNGQIHSCALNNGTPISMAHFRRRNDQVQIQWSLINNELASYPFDLANSHPCAVMQRDFGDLTPLCISFKPEQDEFVWKRMGWS